MNELVSISERQARLRRGLLATASALALASMVHHAEADGDRHPSVWIELGGQFAQEDSGQQPYSPAFLAASPFGAPSSSLEKSAHASWDGMAKFSFETNDGWIFSAAVRYGKTSRNKTSDHQTAHASGIYSGLPFGGYIAYQLFKAKASESHTVLDFTAGRDVGLGGLRSSVLSVGIRFAQFNANTNVEIQSQPTNVNGYGYYHIFRAGFDATRHFNGVGPSVSWNASADLFGNPSSSSISFDWGVNGAILFGRQRVREEHQTTDNYKHYFHYLSVSTAKGANPRDKNVVVPNLGGFAGLSWRTSSARVSFGYRADFYFSAMDGGIDTRKTYDLDFFGPYASVSIGLP
jgi:hypothetical protein